MNNSYKVFPSFGCSVPDVQLLLDQGVHDGREDDVAKDEPKDLEELTTIFWGERSKKLHHFTN
jgi:hypothetical protein